MPPSPAKKQKRASIPSLPTTGATRASLAAAAAAAAASATATASSSTTPAPRTAARPVEQPDSDEEEYHPARAIPPSSKKPSGAFTALSLLSPVRAAEARSNKTLDLLRPSNREAYLAQCVGAVSTPSCKTCSKGLGPWKQCCVVEGFLRGSCANCHYGGEGKRCSLRPTPPTAAGAAPRRSSSAYSLAGTIRLSLSPASHYRQLVEEALRLPRAARASRYANLYLELSALAAADAADAAKEREEGEEQREEDNNNED